MGNDSHKISRKGSLLVVFAVLGTVALVGCHDWPDERVTAIEAQNILRQLSEIETIKDPNIPIPPMYRLPPKKTKQMVGGAEEWKLFYFAKYHTAEKLQTIVREQFSSRIFDAKGEKSQTVPNFAVTASPGTNQIIVRALTEQDVDAILEVIQEIDVPPIQVRIDCMVSELYADLTVDRETTLLIQNLFGEGVAMGGKLDSTGQVLPAFPGAALRDPARETFGLKIGVSRGDEGHRFEALVDLLVSRGYLKILMNPSLEVVNGQQAKIQAKEHVPLQQVTYTSGGINGVILGTRTEYYDIIDSLQITPHVYADGSIGLETSAQIAAYLTPEGIKQLPIVTERTVTNKENRIRHGESLIIGGIRKTEKRDVVRGVPILKDIPVLNLLFSGRDFEERAKEVIFIITPTISSGGVPNQEVVDMLRERHQSPMTQALHEQVMDPLGLKAREDEEERRIDAARAARQEAEAARTAARLEALETSQQVETLEAELEQAKVQMTQLSTKAEEAEAQKREAAADALQARTEADKARAEAEKARAEAEKAKTQTPAEQDAPAKPGAPKEGAKEPGQPASPPQADAAKPPP
jgi:Flp pilus assembly secretin CpaC